ncbi:MAG TPA: peptidase [Clostridia bacterium]|nr:peptidase [Clostridia bacterium]
MKVRGIEVKVHFSTFIFVFLLITAGFIKELIAIFTTVFVHEWGHIYAARKLKVEVLQLSIYPFGGIALLDSVVFIRPDLEILVALAGPMSNIFFAFLGELISQLLRVDMDYFVKANILMAFFNLLPGIPLDGGRVLKSVLSYFVNLKIAIQVGVFSSYLISGIMLYIVFKGIFLWKLNIVYVFLAMLLIIAANKEKKTSAFLRMRDLFRKKAEFYKKGLMGVHHIVVLEKEPVANVIKNFIPYKYHVIIILDEKFREKYRITETELFEFVTDHGLYSSIGDIRK